MYDKFFYSLYNNFNCEINHDNPIETLKKINNLFCNLGIRKNKKVIKLIENEIFKMLELNKKEINIASIINVISLIQLYQPFFDGNHRTSIIFFKIVMKEFVPNFKYYASSKNDEFDNFFSMYYHYNDKPSQKNIKCIKKYIKNSK